MTDMDPQVHYDADPAAEWDRLEVNPVTRLEFENTVRELRQALPEEGHVLDAGGGPGRYAIWLAEQGHDVTHCDLSPELVAFARRKVRESSVDGRVTCGRGDVRALPYEADAFDAVCCLGGVLSHVLDAEERARALGELRHVARPGAPVVVSVIGRVASMQYRLKEAAPQKAGLVGHLAKTGDYTQAAVDRYADGDGWAACHFFRTDELERELDDAGFDVERVVGLEGIASNMGPELSAAPPEVVDHVREVVRRTRTDPTMADLSEHFLTVARAGDDA